VTPQAKHHDPCVLIVEDFVDAREMYQMYLEHAGFCVYTAADGAAGIALALEHHPELIIMDAGLPGITGWEVVKRMKADKRLHAIRVFMLTGHVMADSRRMAKAVGADGFINKPCLPDELLEVIKAAFADKDAPGPWPTDDGDTPPIKGPAVKQPRRPRARQKH
jgi:two-component system, cell cycle response regulator DivK